jgi:hypothetical protein
MLDELVFIVRGRPFSVLANVRLNDTALLALIFEKGIQESGDVFVRTIEGLHASPWTI